MDGLLGTSIAVFLGLTVVIMGGAAWMTGQAIAASWRPPWQLAAYMVLLGFADRFLTFALFEGDGLSVTGFVIDTLVLLAIGAFSYRLTYVGTVVGQYPWLYERTGPLSFRRRPGGEVE